MAAAALSIVAVAASPSAQGQGINITYSELKLGVWDHDTKALRGREKGIDINPEVIFGSPSDDEMVAGLPAWLHWLSQPRPTVGAALNTDGLTDQYYLGGLLMVSGAKSHQPG